MRKFKETKANTHQQMDWNSFTPPKLPNGKMKEILGPKTDSVETNMPPT
jgi:hypothetical protein